MELSALGDLVDQFVHLRQCRLDADKVAASLKSKEHKLQEEILAAMSAADMNVVGGADQRVTRRKSTVLNVTDWPTVHNYIRSTGHVELLQKRIASGVYAELREDGICPHGVVEVEIHKLTVANL